MLRASLALKRMIVHMEDQLMMWIVLHELSILIGTGSFFYHTLYIGILTE